MTNDEDVKAARLARHMAFAEVLIAQRLEQAALVAVNEFVSKEKFVEGAGHWFDEVMKRFRDATANALEIATRTIEAQRGTK